MSSSHCGRGGGKSGTKRGRGRGGYPNKGNSDQKKQSKEEILTLTHDQAEEMIVRFIINEPINSIIDLYHLLRKAFNYHLVKNVKYTKGLPSGLIMKFGAVLLRHYPDFEDIIPQFVEYERLINKRNKQRPCAGAIIFNSTLTKVLCVSHVFLPKQFSFPKGKMEEDETNAKSVAIRECLEETNIDITDFIIEESFIYHRSQGRADVRMFFAVNVPETIEISSIPDEIAFIDWVDIKTLKTNKSLKWIPDQPTQLILKNQIPAFIKRFKSTPKSSPNDTSGQKETDSVALQPDNKPVEEVEGHTAEINSSNSPSDQKEVELSGNEPGNKPIEELQDHTAEINSSNGPSYQKETDSVALQPGNKPIEEVQDHTVE